MMETTGDPYTPAAMTPPTEPGDPPEVRPGWPTAVGIIAVIFGALGILGGCMGMVGNVFATVWGGSIEGMPEVQKAQFEIMGEYVVTNLILTAVGAALAAWLLVAGIGILRRRSWSRRAAVGWAAVKILFAIPVSVLGYYFNQAQFEAMEQAATESATPMPTGMLTFMESFGAAMMGCSMLWAWALPVFLLIWFHRTRVKTEVQRWSNKEPGGDPAHAHLSVPTTEGRYDKGMQ